MSDMKVTSIGSSHGWRATNGFDHLEPDYIFHQKIENMDSWDQQARDTTAPYL